MRNGSVLNFGKGHMVTFKDVLEKDSKSEITQFKNVIIICKKKIFTI